MSEEFMEFLIVSIFGVIALYWTIRRLYALTHPPKSFFQKSINHSEIKSFHSKYGFIERK
ncbi:hypothetical protein [Anaerosinus massiliensis]|uniref:hypothetical protein n=1 Tax=Massilibacillus massiliensis TaxID=1806837 RepID=UPI000DA62B8C|nr:hypothetical protein [Massilibacillus massiliensis]